MKKKAWILAAVVLVAGAAAAKLGMDLRDDRALGDELAARIAELEAAPPAAPASMPEVAPQSAADAMQAGAVDAASAAQSQGPGAGSAAMPPAPATASAPAQASGLKSPAAAVAGLIQNREFVRTMMRSAMTQVYPDLAEEMQFNPQEVEAFFDLLTRHQEELADDSAALLSGTVQDAEARREIQRNMAEKQRMQENELAAHLGAKHGKWEQYQATAAARQQVNLLKTRLAGAGNPLSDEQASKLVTAFSAEQKRILAETREWNLSPAAIDSPNLLQETMQRTVASQRELLDVAKPYLTAAQNDQYRMQVDQQIGMLQAVSGIVGGQGAPGTAPQGAVPVAR